MLFGGVYVTDHPVVALQRYFANIFCVLRRHPSQEGNLAEHPKFGKIPLWGGVARENKTLVSGIYLISRDGVVSSLIFPSA